MKIKTIFSVVYIPTGNARRQIDLFINYFKNQAKGNIAYEIFKDLKNGEYSDELILKLAEDGYNAD